ncbi:rCG44241, partial [Rattus norvegicus]
MIQLGIVAPISRSAKE